MRTTGILVLIGMLFMTAGAWSAVPDFEIRVSPYISVNGERQGSYSDGGFIVTEDQYGMVSFSFYRDATDFSISSVGATQIPVTYLLFDRKPSARPGNLEHMAEMYIRPAVQSDGRIALSGVIKTMSAVGDGDDPLFRYDESKINLTLDNGGKQTVTITSDKNGRAVMADIFVNSDDPLVYAANAKHMLLLKADYRLYNTDRNVFEVNSCKCTLGFPLDGSSGEPGECTFGTTIMKPSGDSVMLMTRFKIRTVALSRGDGTIITVDDDRSWSVAKGTEYATFSFLVERLYLLNPVGDNIPVDNYEAEKGMMSSYSKSVVVHTGENIEIEIPLDADNFLGFDGKEIITLENVIAASSR
ncbi:MAG: hypothetical protein JW763_01360 [candidate division Zixibacteria bacterium]|nr:hypothetical protein [candidate division Zixibacteria bacterium]